MTTNTKIDNTPNIWQKTIRKPTTSLVFVERSNINYIKFTIKTINKTIYYLNLMIRLINNVTVITKNQHI